MFGSLWFPTFKSCKSSVAKEFFNFFCITGNEKDRSCTHNVDRRAKEFHGIMAIYSDKNNKLYILLTVILN